MKHEIAYVLFSLLAPAAFGQVPATIKTPEQFATERVDLYAKALGLDEEMTGVMYSLFLDAEKEAAADRSACQQASANVARILGAQDQRAIASLTDEQRGQLKSLRAKGQFDLDAMNCGAGGSCCSGAKKSAAKTAGDAGQRTPMQGGGQELVAPK